MAIKVNLKRIPTRLLQRFDRNLQEKHSYCLIEDAAHTDLEARSVMTSSYHQVKFYLSENIKTSEKCKSLAPYANHYKNLINVQNLSHKIHKTENTSAASFLMKEESTFQS
jgi:hypothetical protein